MMWNGPFSAMLFINHWEYMQNRSFLGNTIYPFLNGLMDFWGCYLTNKSLSAGGFELVDWPDQAAEGQTVTNPQSALAFVARIAEQLLQMSAALELPAPPSAVGVHEHLTAFNHNGTARNGQSTNGTSTAGSNDTSVVWTNFLGATVQESNMWSLYPFWPGEFYSITAEPPVLAIAQASAKQYLNFPKGRAVQTFSAAVRAGVSGSVRDASDVTKRAPSAPARQWAAIEVIEGMQSFLNNSWGPNLLAYTSGGGIENVGISRAVNEMLLSAEGGVVQLFPAWPAGQLASFTTLRTKGGFLVTAAYGEGSTAASRRAQASLTVLSPIAIQSTASSACQLLDPWPPGPSRTTAHSSASVVSIAPSGQASPVPSLWMSGDGVQQHYVLVFNTSAGVEYEVRLS
jgi:hypothetical protein